MTYRNPVPTVDIIIEVEGGGVILIERGNEPHGWALPGGFVDYGESLEVAAVREAVGDGVDICIDCHGLYNVRDAALLAGCLKPFNLMFLEDPVPPENIEAMGKVTASTSIPICTGELVHRREGFRRRRHESARPGDGT